MTHVRQQIRQGIAKVSLEPVRTRTGLREIFTNRTRPHTQFPSICVYNGRERSVTENPGYINTSQADKRYRREQDFVIEIVVQNAEHSDDALDDLCALVEDAMGADEQVAAAVIAIDYVSCDFQRSGQGTEELAFARLTYRVDYRTAATDATVALN